MRSLKVGPLPWFDETIVESVEPTLIRYRISRGSPMRNHAAVITFGPTEQGCRVHYVIEFDTVLPGMGTLLKVGLSRNIQRGLRKLERLA